MDESCTTTTMRWSTEKDNRGNHNTCDDSLEVVIEACSKTFGGYSKGTIQQARDSMHPPGMEKITLCGKMKGMIQQARDSTHLGGKEHFTFVGKLKEKYSKHVT